MGGAPVNWPPERGRAAATGEGRQDHPDGPRESSPLVLCLQVQGAMRRPLGQTALAAAGCSRAGSSSSRPQSSRLQRALAMVHTGRLDGWVGPGDHRGITT